MVRVRFKSPSNSGDPSLGSISRVSAFLIGLSVTTGVVYVFVIGNTPVYIGYCVAALVVAALLIVNPQKVLQAICSIDESVLVFCGIASLSLVPSLFNCLLFQQGIDGPVTVIKGLVVLIAGLAVYTAAVLLRRCKRAMVCGVAVGIVANVVISLAAQKAFEAGSVLSLYSLFPQDAFVVSLQWGVSEPVGSHAIYSYRAQGLFLEASHMMVFLIAWGSLCVTLLSNAFFRAFLAVGIAYLASQAMSPNVAILLIEALLFFAAWTRGETCRRFAASNRWKVAPATILTLLFLGLAFVFAGAVYGDAIVQSVLSIVESIADLNPISSTDTGTEVRFESMLATISVLPSYPFGAGWNTESLVLTSRLGSSTFASHSFALRLLLEVGILGFASYCWLIWRHAKGASSLPGDGRFVPFSVVCMAVAQFMNGTTLLPYVWLLLGMAKGAELDQKASVSGMQREHGEL